MSCKLIIASNRLPVSIFEKNGMLGLCRSNGGLATALSSLFPQDSSVWVGWTGHRRQLSNQEIAELAIPPNLLPINLSQQEIDAYYDAFSNGILWPLAHGLSPTVRYHPGLWKAVKSITERFAQTIATTIQSEDTIWVHDYHLFLLPQVLRDMGIRNRIGFFLHTPFFPLSQLATLPHAKEILRSLLHTDLIGVQTGRDTRRFHQALKHFNMSLQTQLQAFPIGIDVSEFSTIAASPEVQRLKRENRAAIGPRICIFSLSRLDYTKGIITQLKAYEQLLTRKPELRNKIVYRLNIAPSRESVVEYQNLKEEAEALTAAINRRFGSSPWQPVHYSYINMSQAEITAWYAMSDIHLNTPVADGMNLIAKEYIAARKDPGALIISSAMGAAKQLTDAIIVPAKNIQKITEALEQALVMTNKEKGDRWQKLNKAVNTYQASDWAQDFLHTLA